MPVYEYKAVDSSSKSKTGTVDAKTSHAATTLLKERGLFVISLDESKVNILESLINFRGVPEGELVTFTRQLSTMISAGLPISRALEVLSAQVTNKNMKKVLLEVLREVEGGSQLSVAFSKFPDTFNTTYQALVRAGESSGKLDEILKRLADTLEASRELRSKFKGAMVYPIIVFISMIGVFILMMVFVVPKLANMYESLSVDLPAMTTFMINMSDFFVNRWYVVLIGFAFFIVGIKLFSGSTFGKDILGRLVFALPVFGKITKQKELADFTRTLGLLVASAIPIVESLNIVSSVVKNPAYKKAAIEAANHVEKGNSLSEYMRANKVFPPILSQMASVGEETGQLDSILDKVADFFASETDHAVKGLSAALEPIILIVLGSMVGLLIISIITPIYQITNSIG